MPCRDYGLEDDTRFRQNQQKDTLITNLKLRADELSAFLCFALEGGDIETNQELTEWWVEHQKADALALKRKEKRTKDKKDKSAALKKLSAREKKLLNIK